MNRRLLAGAAALTLSLLAPPAGADESSWSAAMAEGQAALAKGDYLGAISRLLPAARDTDVNAARQAQAQDLLGFAFQEQRNLAAAHVAFKRALEIREAAFGPDDLSVAASHQRLGRYFYWYYLNPLGARDATAKALAIREKALPPDDPPLAESLEQMADVHAVLGNPGEELSLLKRALPIREKRAAQDPAALSGCLLALGNHHRAGKRYTEAAAYLERAIAVDPGNATAHGALGFVYRAQGRAADAAAATRRSTALKQEEDIRQKARAAQFGDYVSEPTWESHNQAGVKAYREKDYAEAEKAFRLALKEAELLGGEDRRLGSTLRNLGLTYRALGREADAAPLLKRAEPLLKR
jgi:tetratricopeptide (TPR) repeat protein